MALLHFIPSNVPASSHSYALDDIPQEVREDVESVYVTLKEHKGRIRVAFDSVDELETYMAQMKSYCELRPAGKLKFRKSNTRDLPKSAMDFRITDFETPAETETVSIRQTLDEVKSLAR